MKNAIIIHGKPSQKNCLDPSFPACSNYAWIPWLQKQLIVAGFPTQTPEMTRAWDPNYSDWAHEFERSDITPETVLVGHSCGGGFLVRWLSEHPRVTVDRVLLVAPWIDPDRQETTNFFEFKIDPDLASRTTSLTIFNSDDDDVSVHKSVDTIRGTIQGAQYREFHRYGHFYVTGKTKKQFPELLEAITK